MREYKNLQVGFEAADGKIFLSDNKDEARRQCMEYEQTKADELAANTEHYRIVEYKNGHHNGWFFRIFDDAGVESVIMWLKYKDFNLYIKDFIDPEYVRNHCLNTWYHIYFDEELYHVYIINYEELVKIHNDTLTKLNDMLGAVN